MVMDTEKREKRDLTPTNDEVEFSDKSYILFPADDSEVRFMGWQKATHETYGDSLRLIFNSTEHEAEDGTPLQIFCYAGASFHPKSKIRQVMNAMGLDLNEVQHDAAGLRGLIGGRLRVNVQHETKTGSDGQPYEIAKITAFLKSKSGKRQPWEAKPATTVTEPAPAAEPARKRRVIEEDDD